VAFLSRYLLALLLFNLSACATMQRVEVGAAMRGAPPPGIVTGSLVEIETIGGERLKFRVTQVNEHGLHGKQGLVAWEDMARLRVEKRDQGEGRTLSVLLGILGVAALAALISSADTVRVCSAPPCPGD